MNASILVVGGDDFVTTVLGHLRGLLPCTIQTAAAPEDADPLIQSQQPDLLILPANQPGSLDLCIQLKEQPRLAWIYCLMVAPTYQADPSSKELVTDPIPMIEALQKGADAYCHLFYTSEVGLVGSLNAASVELLRTHVQVGLRIVNTHREIVRTNDLLSAIALSDPLTELNNRRALEWELPRQIQNARIRSVPLSLVMLDVDFFKSINDTYGHLAGDRALKLLSLRLRNNLRFYDTPFRYGGEEFVIILSNTDEREAPLIAHRICRMISSKQFVIDLLDRSVHLRITVSAGVASLTPEDDEKGLNLLRRADQYLLTAKNNGRNQVVSSLISLPNTLSQD
ncbi:MAG: diguanylate cyclase [Leptolyngbyaceae cyanobacterium bins.59]|nr:diguanylate cyclase [Leptolyngbyaceae cyanobacterium bins.59]